MNAEANHRDPGALEGLHVERMDGRIRRMRIVQPISNLRGNTLASRAMHIVDPLQQCGCTPMKTDHMNLTVDMLRNGENSLIESMSGDRQFFVNAVE